MEERRKHTRVQLPTFPIRFTGDQEFRCHLENLSKGGLLVRTRKVRPVNTAVNVELEPPDGGATLTLEGRVARIEFDQSSGETVPVGMGVRFVDLAPEIETRLADLLTRYENLLEDADGEVAEISDAGILRQRIESADRQIERAERHVVQLQRELEFARQADLASRSLLDQLELSRKSEADAEQELLGEVHRLTARRAELEDELSRRRSGAEDLEAIRAERRRGDQAERLLETGRRSRREALEAIDQRIERPEPDRSTERVEQELARVGLLMHELEHVRGELEQGKKSAPQRLEDAREDLEQEREARREAEEAQVALEARLAAVQAEIHTLRSEHDERVREVAAVVVEEPEAPPQRATPPPPPPDALRERRVEAQQTPVPAPPAETPPALEPANADAAQAPPPEPGDAIDLATAISGELLPGPEPEPGAEPLELRKPRRRLPPPPPPPEPGRPPRPPRRRPRWLALIGGTVAGSGLVIAAVALGTGWWPPEDAARAPVEAAATVEGDAEDAAPPVEAPSQPTVSLTEDEEPVLLSSPTVEPEDETSSDGGATDASATDASEPPDEPEESSVGEPTPPEADPAPAEGALEADPADPLAVARELQKQGRFRPALKAYKDAAATNSDSPHLHAGMGHVLLEIGNAKQAIVHLERAIRLRPTMATAHLYLGTAYWEEGRNAEARAAFTRFLELAPRSPRASEIRNLLKNIE